MKIFRAIRLFLKIVFQEWEDKKGGILEPYRLHYRITPNMALEIACRVHGLRDKYSWE